MAEVPPAVVTVMSTVPAASAGETATTEVSDFTEMLVEEVVPNETAVAAVRPVPVIVTEVPPLVPPVVGLIAVTVGNGAV